MKKIIFAFIFIFSCRLVAQDTNIVKFLPLKVGNIWVFSSDFNKKARIEITGTLNANGHIYYVFGMSGDSCHCAQGSSPPFQTPLYPMRIDSVTGNIMQYGNPCGWYVNEHLLDSLKAKVGQFLTNSCNSTYCYDTNYVNVFGESRKTIAVGLNIMTYYTNRRYAYGIGLMASVRGCFFSSCSFNLLGCVIDGILHGDTSMIVGLQQVGTEVPENFYLYQNYPNPFNPTTNIKFSVPQKSFVTITIYNVLGEEISKLVNEEFSAGTYEANWDATNYPSGVYYYQLTISNGQLSIYKETKKMLLIK